MQITTGNQIPYCEADSRSAIQNIECILYRPQDQYCVRATLLYHILHQKHRMHVFILHYIHVSSHTLLSSERGLPSECRTNVTLKVASITSSLISPPDNYQKCI
jgi:hypothetical protein